MFGVTKPMGLADAMDFASQSYPFKQPDKLDLCSKLETPMVTGIAPSPELKNPEFTIQPQTSPRLTRQVSFLDRKLTQFREKEK